MNARSGSLVTGLVFVLTTAAYGQRSTSSNITPPPGWPTDGGSGVIIVDPGTDPGREPTDPYPPRDPNPPRDPDPYPPDNGGSSGNRLVDDVRDYIYEFDMRRTPKPPRVRDSLFRLGQAIFFDKELSGNRNISCSTCHLPDVGAGDGRAMPLGEGGRGEALARRGGPTIPRNAPHVYNLHTFEETFWDGRIFTDSRGRIRTPGGNQITQDMIDVFEFGIISAQAMFPATSPIEMRGTPGENELANIPDDDLRGQWRAMMRRFGRIPRYVQMFEDAYPGERFRDMTFAHAANAIAGFEIRAFSFRNSPWDKFLGGNDNAMSRAQLEGALDFFETGCAECHNGVGLSDFDHHNTGLAQFGPGQGDGRSGRDDFGHERVTGKSRDRYTFRTPPLFNVEITGPWGHIGQFNDLTNFLDHYVDVEDNLYYYRVRDHVARDESYLWNTQLDNIYDVLNNLDPLVEQLNFRGNPSDRVRSIEAFLRSLTDPAARNPSGIEPRSVPSGLRVGD